MGKYQYNECVLPELPGADEWNRDVYPYAVIVHRMENDAFVLLCINTPYIARVEDGTYRVSFPSGVSYRFFYCFETDEAWTDDSDYQIPGNDGSTEYVYITSNAEYVWTNEDITNESGTVIFTGTEPVLVRPPISTFDLKSWLIGFVAGLAGKPLPVGKAGAGDG